MPLPTEDVWPPWVVAALAEWLAAWLLPFSMWTRRKQAAFIIKWRAALALVGSSGRLTVGSVGHGTHFVLITFYVN